MVHGEAAPIQVLLHPLVPQQPLKNCMVNGTFTCTQLGGGMHDATSLKIETFVPVHVPLPVKSQYQ
jgi:hypothetical protein